MFILNFFSISVFKKVDGWGTAGDGECYGSEKIITGDWCAEYILNKLTDTARHGNINSLYLGLISHTLYVLVKANTKLQQKGEEEWNNLEWSRPLVLSFVEAGIVVGCEVASLPPVWSLCGGGTRLLWWQGGFL